MPVGVPKGAGEAPEGTPGGGGKVPANPRPLVGSGVSGAGELVGVVSVPKVGRFPVSAVGFGVSSGLHPWSRKPAKTPTWMKSMMKTAAK